MLLSTLLLFMLQNTWSATGAPIDLAHPQTVFDRALENEQCAVVTVQDDMFGINHRSTWEIARDCLLTIFACTWITVHPNIRGHSSSIWKRALERAKLMFWAIMAPELVLGWAVRQYIGAKEIQRLVSGETIATEKASNPTSVGAKWTRTHSHFAQMGGYVFDIDGRHQYVDLRWNNELKHQAIRALIKRAESEDQINDRSKGDFLAKAFVILQTFWFITQAIARGATGLAITELELITLAYAILNGAMYFCWWDKPLDVQCPIVVKLPCSNSSNAIHPDDPQRPSNTNNKRPPLNTDLSEGIRQEAPMSAAVTALEDVTNKLNISLEARPVWIKASATILFVYPATIAQYIMRCVIAVGTYIPSQIEQALSNDKLPVLSREESPAPLQESSPPTYPTFYAYPPQLPRVENVPYIVAFFFASVFGAVHCLSWLRSFTFPTPLHETLWLSSAILICGTPVVVTLGFYVTRYGAKSDSSWLDDIEKTIPFKLLSGAIILVVIVVMFIVVVVTVPLSLLALIAYIPARCILIVLSFVELAHLPPTAHQTVEWTSFFLNK